MCAQWINQQTNRFPLIMDGSWPMKALDYTQKYLARCFYWLEAYFRGKSQETRIPCSNRFGLLYASLLLSDLFGWNWKRWFVCFITLVPELTQVPFPSKDQDLRSPYVMNPASELRLRLCRAKHPWHAKDHKEFLSWQASVTRIWMH